MVMLGERDVIERYFSFSPSSASVVVGVGDDAAVLSLTAKTAMSVDTLVEGSHFHQGTDPYCLGRKSLTVNLSDLAATGAKPTHALLSLTLPGVDHDWLEQFAKGFAAVANEHDVSLVGGDLTHGAVTVITVTVIGDAAAGVLLQSNAKHGDDLWVSGEIGAAGALLRSSAPASLGSALHDPSARVALGQALVGTATAVIDLSDGLCAGILSLAQRSGVRIEANAQAIPVAAVAGSGETWDGMLAAVCSGEDYELLFAAPQCERDKVMSICKRIGLRLTRIGSVVAGQGAILKSGEKVANLEEVANDTYQHFSIQENTDPVGQEAGHELAAAVGKAAQANGFKLFVAESCTGGMLSGALTANAGSSDWFIGGAVTYSVAAKQSVLGVKAETVAKHGVVSTEVAQEMCVGALAMSSATHAASVTGWAGPEGGDGQETGTVCIGWAGPKRRLARKFHFHGDRQAVRLAAVQAALTGWLVEINRSA